MARRKKVVLTGLLVILIILFIFIFQKQIPRNTEILKEFIRSFRIFGPLMIILLIIFSMVFSPVVAFPFWLTSLALYGFWETLFYVLLANNVGSVINFWIARRLGRPVVVKFVSKKGLKKIDEIAEIMGLQILILGRVLGGASGDYLSYAAGLTQMRFKPYFLITFFGTLPVITLNVFIIHRALVANPLYLVGLAIIGYTLAIGIPILVYRKKVKPLQ